VADRALRAYSLAHRPVSREGLQSIADICHVASDAMHRLELKIPPAVTGAVTASGMWLVSRTLPAFAFTFAPLRVVAMVMGIAGAVTTGWAVVSFRSAQTTLNPTKPYSSSSLVRSGIYRVTRNPMYLGLLFVLVGWALYLANVLAFPFLPAFILYMNHFQIEPEERALTSLFGQEFLEYASRVRRWI
jgi:protein-S-isoprenylcysteine O-methyltransferase Ste14